MAFAKKWAGFISYVARISFFLLIILQVPLFRVPCRGGICTTPLELTCIAIQLPIPIVVKSLLYPGAVANAVFSKKEIPNFNIILQIYPNIKNFGAASYGWIDLRWFEVLVGSYLCVAGAILGCLRPGRMGLAGTLLTLWGLKKEPFLSSQTQTCQPKEAVFVFPVMPVAVVLAFISIKGDVRKLIRCFRRRRKSKYY